jgi:hypothetical protein
MMVARKKSDAPKKASSRTKTTVEKVQFLKTADGTIDGEYTRSIYINGELISFDIDWDKLKEHMKKVG